jgi:hypothetical protein
MSRALPSVLAVLLLTTATAGADSIWTHSGSEMRLRARSDRRTIVYEVPRAGVVSQGVERGTVLFEGTVSDNWIKYTGTAYLFSARCGRIGYAVTGQLEDDGKLIVMSGMAPVRDPSTCVVKGTRSDNLNFVFVRSDEPPVKFPPLKEGAVCTVEDPDEYKACVEGLGNQICKGRTELEDLVRCFRAALLVVYEKSQMSGVAGAMLDAPSTTCTADGVCSLQGGGPSPSCVRLDAKRVRECDGNIVNERCVDVACPIRECRKVCSKGQ